MKKYKILKKVEDIYYSPFQNYKYGKLEDFIGKEMILPEFDDNKNKECSSRYYATDIDGLIYTNLSGNKVLFEMEMNGKNVLSSKYKQGFEKQTFIREMPIDEVKKLVKEESNKMDWNYYDMMFPVNPLNKVVDVNKDIVLLLKEWASVRDSVWDSVWDSVRDSVWASVRDSVWDSVWDSVGASVRDSVWDSVWDSVRASVRDSVWDSVGASVGDSVRDSVGDSVRASVWNSVGTSVWASVRDSVRAFISSGFPDIKKWKYIEHKEGVNPFQSCIDLWNKGFVPSFDGKKWRLHSGEKAEIVFEISKEDLYKY